MAEIVCTGYVPEHVWIDLVDSSDEWKTRFSTGGFFARQALASNAVRFLLERDWHMWGDGLEELQPFLRYSRTAADLWSAAVRLRDPWTRVF